EPLTDTSPCKRRPPWTTILSTVEAFTESRDLQRADHAILRCIVSINRRRPKTPRARKQFRHGFTQAVADFEQDATFESEIFMRPHDDPTIATEPVRPALERQLRFPVANLRCEGCDVFGQYVRRIGNNDVKAVTKLSDRIQQITVQELNPFCDAVPPGVD